MTTEGYMHHIRVYSVGATAAAMMQPPKFHAAAPQEGKQNKQPYFG